MPGVEGEFTVLPGHAPVISALRPGVIEVTLAESGETERIFVKGGFAEVDADRVTVLAERAMAVDQMSADVVTAELESGRGRARRCRRRRRPPRRRFRGGAAARYGALSCAWCFAGQNSLCVHVGFSAPTGDREAAVEREGRSLHGKYPHAVDAFDDYEHHRGVKPEQ